MNKLPQVRNISLRLDYYEAKSLEDLREYTGANTYSGALRTALQLFIQVNQRRYNAELEIQRLRTELTAAGFDYLCHPTEDNGQMTMEGLSEYRAENMARNWVE